MLIISNNLPITTTDSEAFRKLLLAVHQVPLTIPNRQAVTSEITSIYYTTRLKLLTKLSTYKDSGGKFNLCIDAWTSKSQHAFLGISIHFMDPEFRPESYLLQLADLKRRHTGVYMAKVLSKTLKSFKIDDRIHCITRDNASSNHTLFQAFEDSYRDNYGTPYTRAVPCVDHILNLICQDILKYMKATISDRGLLDITAQAEEVVEEELEALTKSSSTSVDPKSTISPKLKRDSKGPPTKRAKRAVKHSKTALEGLNAFQKLRWIVGKLRL
jgi:hypothetical protein